MKRTSIAEKGQALIETALILPIIIIVLVGMIDFGLLFNNYLLMTNAAREGARYAVIGSNDNFVENIIRNATSTLEQSELTVTISPAPAFRKTGDEITIAVEYDNTLLTPILNAIVPNPIHLTTQMVMRIE